MFSKTENYKKWVGGFLILLSVKVFAQEARPSNLGLIQPPKIANLFESQTKKNDFEEKLLQFAGIESVVFSQISWLPPIQKTISEHLITTYSVTPELAIEVVTSVFEAAKHYNIDPFIILGIIKIESQFKPTAVSAANAKGLMQILPTAHRKRIESVGGIQKLDVPHENIKMGSAILREFMNRTNGSVPTALQLYNGSINDENRSYSRKVIAAKNEFEKASKKQFF